MASAMMINKSLTATGVAQLRSSSHLAASTSQLMVTPPAFYSRRATRRYAARAEQVKVSSATVQHIPGLVNTITISAFKYQICICYVSVADITKYQLLT